MMNVSNIISLGVDCFPRTILTRGGIQKTKDRGGLTCPFDLTLTPYTSVCKLIDDEFRHFTDNCFLKLNDSGIITNIRYNVLFMHESENKRMIVDFCKKKFIRLAERYEQRIKNFYHRINESINQNSYLIFVVRHNALPFELKKIIEKKFPKLKFILVTLNVRVEGSKTVEPISIVDSLGNHRMSAYNINFPRKNYIWHESEHYDSQEGRSFERHVCDIFRDVLDESKLPL